MTAMPIEITYHAAMRYCERVNPALTPIEALAVLRSHSRAIAVAAEFGCRFVKLSAGVRLVLCRQYVVTVLGPSQFPCRLAWDPAA